MSFPVLTAFYAGLLALIYAVLSTWVIFGRGQFRILLGDGGDDRLSRRIRAHGNFAEYVPFIVLLAGLLEAGGAGAVTIHALLLPLTVARVMHPIGMLARDGSPRQFMFRGTGAMATLVILAAAGILLLLRAT